MKSTFALLPLLLLGMCAEVSLAQGVSSADEDSTTYRNRVLFLPAIGSSPETGFLLGAVAVPQFKIGDAGPETRSSSVLLSGIYTFRNQILISVLPDLILPREEWVIQGDHFLTYFPEYIWGAGPHTREEDKLSVIYTRLNLKQSVLKQVAPSLFAGPYLHASRLYNVRFEDSDGAIVDDPGLRGSDGSTVVGLGGVVRWDRRNSNMTPTENYLIEFTAATYPSWAGSSDPYGLYLADARRYVDLTGDASSVLALQALVRLTSGSPPFTDLSKLGSDKINRGYYEGRFRDQNSAQLQAELRQHVKGRVGFTLFAATGDVWDRFDTFSMSTFKWSAGAGFRFNLNPEDTTNIRIDLGFGRESVGFYLQFGEAF
ncbi:MAG: BamA/TamA family outer membrane protein [Bacteroidota bacterium]